VRRSSVELAGEFLRETGVLVSVFYGLAAALLATTHEIPLSTAFIGTAMGLSLWVSGVLVERRRRE
jgi:hypothetical protein